MKIGIIGAGHIGGTLAWHFVDAGHEVAVSNSRRPETLAGLVEQLGGGARALTAAGAARFGDVVVVSVPFGRYRELPTEAVAGKVVIDTNNYYHSEMVTSRSSTATAPPRASCSKRMPSADVVKAFNAIVWTRLRDDCRPAGDGERVGIPISGDEE